MWRNRNVWIVLIGEFVVGIGLWAGIIGNLAFMTKLVPSDFHKSVILAIGMLAGLLVAPLAGRIIDSTSKKKVLLLSSLARIVSVLFMFIAIYTQSIFWMVAFLISLQIAATFFMPALQSVIPMIVKDKDLLELNAWNMNIRTLSRIVGAAAAGVMVSYFDILWLYVVSFIMYIAMYFILKMLVLEPDAEADGQLKKGKEKGSFKEVLPVLRQFPVVLVSLVLMIIPILFLGSFNLIIMKLSEMHDSTSLSGLIYTVEGVGFMLGAFLIKRIGQKFKTGSILFTSVFLVGFLQLMMYFTNIEWVGLVIFGVFGFAVGCFFPTTITIFQRQVPKEYHGRFFAFRNMMDQTAFQVVLLSTGALLDLVGLQIMGVIFGVFSLALSISFVLYLKAKRMAIAFE